MINFEKAAEILCDIWSNIPIDGHPVKCYYRSPTDKGKEVIPPSKEWVEEHCSISKYCLQISKCGDVECCGELRSNIRNIIKDKFIPGPLLIKRSIDSGIQLADIGDQPIKEKVVYTDLFQTMMLSHLKPVSYENVKLPYDLFCPSVQKKISDKDENRYVCMFSKCKNFFTTLDLANRHASETGHKKLARKEDMDQPDTPIIDVELSETAPIICI